MRKKFSSGARPGFLERPARAGERDPKKKVTRGPGRRPERPPRTQPGPRVVFLGARLRVERESL